MKSIPALIVAFAFFPAAAFAQAPKTYTADALFSEAMKNGRAEGILVGPQADHIRQQTHSTEPTQAKAVRGSATADGCQVFLMTLTQAKIPSRSGQFVGDYVTTTKLTLCRDDRQPTVEVVDCRVGSTSCLPPSRPQATH